MTNIHDQSANPVRRRRKNLSALTNCKPLPPQSDLVLFFTYEPETGDLYRIAEYRHGGSKEIRHLKRPRKVTKIDRDGYLRTNLYGRSGMLASRVIWKIQTGEDPGPKEVDHINGNRADNRWANLRLAERRENQWNTGKRQSENGAATMSKYKGVTYKKNHLGEHTYIYANIGVNGQKIYLGTFPTEEAAYAAYCEAAKKYHGEFARLE